MRDTLRRWWPIPLRLLVGIAFIYHAFPKLFTAAGHRGLTAQLTRLRWPLPGLTSWIVGIVEFFGGIALILGVFVALATALLIVEMIVAMLLVHLPHGFSFVNIERMTPAGPIFGLPGIEVNLLYIAALLALFIGGPGPLSIEEAISGRAPARTARGAPRPATT